MAAILNEKWNSRKFEGVMLTVGDDLKSVFRVPDGIPNIEIYPKIVRK
jgi:hypothetical protein